MSTVVIAVAVGTGCVLCVTQCVRMYVCARVRDREREGQWGWGLMAVAAGMGRVFCLCVRE